MDTLLPIEISNIIYLERATLRLKDICREYHLDFNRFCQYLKEYNGRLTGSGSLTCIDPECEFGDLDLFIFVDKDQDTRFYYKEFFKVFTIDQSEITVGKTPLDNSDLEIESDKQPQYLYTFEYHDKKIDMSLINDICMDEIDLHHFFDISKIFFNGTEWNLPPSIKNIQHFLDHKKIQIINPFDTYFDKIYNGFFRPDINDLSPIMNNFILPSNQTKIKDVYSWIIYKWLQPFYVDKVYEEVPWSLMIKERDMYKFKQEINTMKPLLHMISFDQRRNNNTLIDTIIKWKEAIHEHSPFKDKQMVQFALQNGETFEMAEFNMNDLALKQINQLFRYYKGFYKILQYIGKGYVITNIDDFLYS